MTATRPFGRPGSSIAGTFHIAPRNVESESSDRLVIDADSEVLA